MIFRYLQNSSINDEMNQNFQYYSGMKPGWYYRNQRVPASMDFGSPITITRMVIPSPWHGKVGTGRWFKNSSTNIIEWTKRRRFRVRWQIIPGWLPDRVLWQGGPDHGGGRADGKLKRNANHVAIYIQRGVKKRKNGRAIGGSDHYFKVAKRNWHEIDAGGSCSGIEKPFGTDDLEPGHAAYFVDYFPDDFIMMIDESHRRCPDWRHVSPG